jgi:hypothetical protein
MRNRKFTLLLFLLFVSVYSFANSEKSESGNLLDQLGSLSSIIGLLITIILAIIGYLINNRIREIQRDIQFDARIKSLIKQLEKSKSSYPKFLQDYSESIKSIRFEISQTEVILRNINMKITGSEKKAVNNLIKKIKRMKMGEFINEEERPQGFFIFIQSFFIDRLETSEEDLWNFYTELSAIQTQLENLIEDKSIKQYV